MEPTSVWPQRWLFDPSLATMTVACEWPKGFIFIVYQRIDDGRRYLGYADKTADRDDGPLMLRIQSPRVQGYEDSREGSEGT